MATRVFKNAHVKIPKHIDSQPTFNTSITNYQFVQWTKNINPCDEKSKKQIITSTLKLYNNITGPKNHYAITKLLKIFTIYPVNPTNIQTVCQDIYDTNNQSNVPINLIIKAVSNSVTTNLSIEDTIICVQILQSLLIDTTNNSHINCVLISAMLTAFIKNGKYKNALNLYERYVDEYNNDVLHLLAIKSCTKICDFEYGYKLISQYINVNDKNKLNCHSHELLSVIIHFYGKCGDVHNAYNIFNNIDSKNEKILTPMMNVYCDNQMETECLELFEKYVFNDTNLNIKPDHFTFAIALKACIHQSALLFGEKIHKYLNDNHANILQRLDIQINLICLYGKNQKYDICQQLFEQCRNKYGSQIKLWDAILTVYARNGKTEQLLNILYEMKQNKELMATDKTYFILLSAYVTNKDDRLLKIILDDLSDIKCIDDTLLDIKLQNKNNITVKQLCDILNVFICCLKIKLKIIDDFTDNFGNLPTVRFQNIYNESDINSQNSLFTFKQILKTVYLNKPSENRHIIEKLINKLKENKHNFSNKEWLKIIDALGLIFGDINLMMNEYKNMLLSDIQKINSNILITLLHRLIRNGETQYVNDIWNDIKNNSQRFVLNSLVLQSLILCVYKTRYNFNKTIVNDMWDLIINKYNIRPNLHCYSTAILTCSKFKDEINQNMCKQLLNEIQTNGMMLSLLKTKPLAFRQILTAYGNTNELDNMWSFYNMKHKYKHDIVGLTIVAKFETCLQKLNYILDIIDKYFNVNNDLSIDQLILFHRIANKCGNYNYKNKFWNILETKQNKIRTNVFAQFDLNGRIYFISNGYEECQFNSNILVEELIKEINYNINVSNCNELPDLMSKQKHLKYHVEKKALAILIKKKEKHLLNLDDNNIRIKVTMPMCIDCHEFFCQISNKYCDYNIECIDPKGNHLFRNGICYLCHNQE